MNDILASLTQILAERKAQAKADSSYVAQLHAKGFEQNPEKQW